MSTRLIGGRGAPARDVVAVGRGGGGENKPTEDGGVPVKAVSTAKGRGSARPSDAGPNEVSLGSSLFVLILSRWARGIGASFHLIFIIFLGMSPAGSAQATGGSTQESGATCKAMKKYAQSRGLDSNFTVKDARNKIGETAKEKALDATNAVKELLRLRDEEGVHVHFETDEDARLDTVFFEMPGAAAKFARGASIGGSQRVHVILYDTTFNTNRKGLKLGFITSVDEHRRTYILATTMVMNEDHESFEWCFAEFKKAFGVESTAIFTDSDPALARAIAKELPHSKHYLCTFHLSLNLTTNCKAAFPRDERPKTDQKKKGATKDAWWGFKSAWWRLVKDSDQARQATYSTQWVGLKGLVEAQRGGGRDAAVEKALAWLGDLYKRREKWAAPWTWGVMTLGIHSTQRAESVHNAFKAYLNRAGGV